MFGSVVGRSAHGRTFLASLLLLVAGLTTPALADAGPLAASERGSASVKRAGKLSVFVGPLLPMFQRQGHFLRGEEVTLQAAQLDGLRDRPTVESKARRGWRPMKGVQTSVYKKGSLGVFTFAPRAGERRYRVVWNRRGKVRVTNAVTVTSAGRWSVVPVVEGIAAATRSVRISGNGAVLVHAGDSSAGWGLFATDRAGAVEAVVPAGYVDLRSVSSDGRFIFYGKGDFSDAQPLAATTTIYMFDRTTKSHTALATWKVYDKAGTQLRFLAAAGDGQYALFQRSTDGLLDALILRNLATLEEAVVYVPTADERSAGVKVGAATLSDDGGTVAFGLGSGKMSSVRIWRQASGQVTEVATSAGDHILGRSGGAPVLQLSNDAGRLLYDNQRRLQMLDLTTGAVTLLPLNIVVGSTDTVELSGNGSSVLLASGAATGIYRVDTGQWVGLDEDPQVASIADDGRTVPFTKGLSGNTGGLHLLVAP